MTRPSWQDYGTYDESEHARLWDGVIGAWCPALGPTGGRLFDHSRGSRWGTLTNMDNATDWVVDDGQYSLDFDGTNDFIDVGTSGGLWASLTGALTVSCWIRVFNDGGERAICAASTNGNQATFAVVYGYANAGKFQLWNNAAGAAVSSSQSINDGKWHHCVATRGGSGSFIFVDGAQSNSAAGTTGQTDATATLSIGRFGGFNGYYADFRISEVVIYNRALSANEVRDLYVLGRGGVFERRRRSRRRAIEQALTGARRRRILTGMV